MNDKTLIEEIVTSRLYQIPINNNNKFIIKSTKEAYAIQDIVNEKLILSGYGKIEGYKIGCTNKVIQKELSINHPILGVFFENKIIKNNSSISLNKFIQAGVECELYAVIGEDVTSETPYNYKNINEFISHYGVSLEIVENRFKNFPNTNAHLIIADGSLGNSIVIGNKIVNKKILNLNELIGRIYLNDQEIANAKVYEQTGATPQAIVNRSNTLTSRSLTVTFISKSTGAYKHMNISMDKYPVT